MASERSPVSGLARLDVTYARIVALSTFKALLPRRQTVIYLLLLAELSIITLRCLSAYAICLAPSGSASLYRHRTHTAAGTRDSCCEWNKHVSTQLTPITDRSPPPPPAGGAFQPTETRTRTENDGRRNAVETKTSRHRIGSNCTRRRRGIDLCIWHLLQRRSSTNLLMLFSGQWSAYVSLERPFSLGDPIVHLTHGRGV